MLALASVLFIDRDEGGAPASTQMPAPPMFPKTGAAPGQPPDLSTMTPRQAADRLFNRIMMASEQGNKAQAMRFVPMAVQAYGMAGAVDADAHYHLGLIHLVAGDIEKMREQIGMIRQRAPSHLLAFILDYTLADRSGNKAAAAAAVAGFTAAYDMEIKTARQEYADHRKTIERFRAEGGVTLAKP